MDEEKRKRLEEKGWKVGTVDEFLSRDYVSGVIRIVNPGKED